MKHIKYKIYVFILIPFFSFAQVGIGTQTVSNGIALQVESKPSSTSTTYGGIIFPNIALTSASSLAPIRGTSVSGLIVYNTATAGSSPYNVTPGYYYWNGNLSPAQWVRWTQLNPNKSAQFSNQDTTTDLNGNSAGIFADIFYNVRFNNDTNLYTRVDSKTLQVNEAGYYKVVLSLDLSSSGGADNFGVEIIVNNATDIVSENIYIPGRWDSEGGAESNFPNGKSFVVYVPINVAGHTIKVKTYEIDPSTDVKFKNANTSTFSIQKLR